MTLITSPKTAFLITADPMWLILGKYIYREGPVIDMGKMDDTSVTASTYGKAIPLIYGPENRTGGNIIWSTGLIETKKKTKKSGKGSTGTTTVNYSYRVSFACAIAGRELSAIKKIWANNKLIYNADDYDVDLPAVDPVNGQIVTKAFGTHTVMSEMRFYPGTTTQVADSVIEAVKGVGQTSAYRGIAYVVLKDLQLADFGNRIPNLEFECSAEPSITVGETLHDLCTRSGVSNPSVVGLNEELRGMIVNSESAENAMKSLSAVFNFDITQQRGDVRFIKRGFGMKGTIPLVDMGAHSSGTNRNDPIEFETDTALDLPKEASITFKDPDLDFQANTQRTFKETGSASNKYSLTVPITIGKDTARRVIDRILWEMWTSRRTAKFRTDDKWVRRDPGDLLGIPIGDQVIPYRMSRSTRGDNGIVDIEVLRDDEQIYDSSATGIDGILPANTVRFPGVTDLVLIDSPIYRDLDNNSGFYWAVTAVNDGWRGAEIVRSSDGGATYNEMSEVAVRAVIGDVAAALPTGPTDYWDRGNSITVILTFEDEELESLSEEAILNGNNAFWLGGADGQDGEVLQFATATLVAPSTYTLTNLLRGRRGTESFVGTHGTNEVFVLLQPELLGRTDYGASDWDKERLFKPVSFLTDEVDTASQAFTNTGVGLKPFSPVHVLGVRDTSNNLTVTWVRRTRLQTPGLGNGPAPLGESTESYEVDIFSGANVVRTITATTPTIAYSAVDQNADGLVPGNPVILRIYQMSDVRGRGFPAISTV